MIPIHKVILMTFCEASLLDPNIDPEGFALLIPLEGEAVEGGA